VAAVAAWLRVEGEQCSAARIALGAVAPTPLLAQAAGQHLMGKPVDQRAIQEAAALAPGAAAPISDLRGSEEHRRELVVALCSRALHSALGRIR
jgi:carbon-monoxide dehydrogenase medium subunit